MLSGLIFPKCKVCASAKIILQELSSFERFRSWNPGRIKPSNWTTKQSLNGQSFQFPRSLRPRRLIQKRSISRPPVRDRATDHDAGRNLVLMPEKETNPELK